MQKFFLIAAFGAAIMSLLIACDGEKAIFLDNSDEFVEMQFAPNGIDVNITPLLKASDYDRKSSYKDSICSCFVFVARPRIELGTS